MRNSICFLLASILCITWPEAAHSGILRLEGSGSSIRYVDADGNEEATLTAQDVNDLKELKQSLSAISSEKITTKELVVDGLIHGKVAGGYQISRTPWWNFASGPSGYIRLITPIVHNESNMFSITIRYYGYSKNQNGYMICGGYAYAATTLISHSCDSYGSVPTTAIITEDVEGQRVVVIRIGDANTSWYYQHFQYEYVGWKEHDPSAFKWTKSPA